MVHRRLNLLIMMLIYKVFLDVEKSRDTPGDTWRRLLGLKHRRIARHFGLCRGCRKSRPAVPFTCIAGNCRDTNFADAQKWLPPSFGSAAAPDFLPPPPRQRGVVVVLQSRFRCRIRREASSLQGLYKLGRRKWKQQPTLKSSYEAKGRGSNYPQPGWAWGEPKWWG